MNNEDIFWLNDPTILFREPRIIPGTQLTEYQKLNAITCLILLFTLILWIFKLGSWILFLIFGISLVMVLYIVNTKTRKKIFKNSNEYPNLYTSLKLNNNQKGGNIDVIENLYCRNKNKRVFNKIWSEKRMSGRTPNANVSNAISFRSKRI